MTKPARTPWTPEQLRLLRELYPHHPTRVAIEAIGRGEKSVYMKAHELGLKKSPEYLATDASARFQRGRTNPGIQTTQFKPGVTPWNKGLSTGNAHPNNIATRFQAGRPPKTSANYLPVGSIRTTRDGYFEQKMSDDRSLTPARRWTALHRLAWERERGPIPPGHIVVFKRGMKTSVAADITSDRLECISRADNARRNDPGTNDPQLKRLYQLKGVISRQVSRITREHAQKEQTR